MTRINGPASTDQHAAAPPFRRRAGPLRRVRGQGRLDRMLLTSTRNGSGSRRPTFMLALHGRALMHT